MMRMVISCLAFVFLFPLTYPRLTLIITGKKFFPFKIAITPSSFHCCSQTVLELQLFLLHVLCINQDNYQECGHCLCYTKLCHLHTCLIFTLRPFDIIHTLRCIHTLQKACEQALWGALVVGQEKEGELATIYVDLEFEYLHRKSQCEMLIGRDVISNGVITLGTCFSMFVHVHARFRFTLISRNLSAQSTGSHRRIGHGFKFHRCSCKLSFLLPSCHQSAPESLVIG